MTLRFGERIFFLFCILAMMTTVRVSQAATSTVGLNEFLNFFSQKQSKESKPSEQINRESCLRDEMQIFDIESGPIKSLKYSIQNKNENYFKKLSLHFPALGEMRLHNGVESKNWMTEKTGDSFESRLRNYTTIANVEAAILDYNVTKRTPDERILKLDTIVYLSISGHGKKGVRQVDRGRWQISLDRSDTGWAIEKMVPLSGESLVSTKSPQFTEQARKQNIKGIPLSLRTEAIRRGGYALAVADVNNDNLNDIAVGARDGFKLFRGSPDGSYKDFTKQSGLGHLKFVKTAIFADFENRGVQDLIVTTLQPSSENYSRGHSSVLLFKGKGDGTFEHHDVNFGKKRGFLQPMPAAVADFNNDGYLDLYVGYPGSKDFTVFQKQMENQSAQGLYLNDKKGGFLDFTDTFAENDDTERRKLFPHGSMAVNFDQTGGVDLLIADDRNNLSPAYVNSGKSKLELKNMAQQIGLGNYGYAMSMAASDVNNDGVTDLAWTNVNFHSAQRSKSACDKHWKSGGRFSENGLRIFAGSGKGHFKEMENSNLGHAWTGDGASGVLFFDYDNDGHIDIYLTNGLWSGTPQGQDVQTVFSSMIYTTTEELLVHVLKPENQAGFKEVLAEMRGHIDPAHFKIVKSKERPSLAGFQKNRLYRNNGDGSFTDLAFFEGVDSIADGYVVGSIINQSGAPDLLLRNGDAGTDSYSFPAIQYFSNKGVSSSKSLVLKLQGSRTNRDAIGTFVIATSGGKRQVQHLVSNMGSVQSERSLHFGLGSCETIDKLEIYWPSGKVQTMTNIKPGRLLVVEKNENPEISKAD